MTASVLQRLNILYMARFMADAVRRFPLPALLSAALTALTLCQIHDYDVMPAEIFARGAAFCVVGFVLALGIALYREGHGTSASVSVAAALAGLGLLLLAFFMPAHLAVGHLFLSGAIGVFLLIAPFAYRAVSGDNVWGFVYKSAIAVMFGGVSTIILAGGLSAILASIGYLFEIKINSKLYADIWAIGWCLFFPLYVLAGVPRALDSDNGPCDIPAPVSFIANYLLVPMMLAYTGILYAYGIKIAFEWALPRGNLAYMVTGFGIVGILTHLAIYPMRERGKRLLRFYFKAFYILLPVPLLLLAVGLWTRISEYGVTEQRYAIGLCLVWLAGLVILKTILNSRMHIKHVPMLLCALLLIASFGPWSAQDISLKSQYTRLQNHLMAAGILAADGKVQKATENVSFENRRAISSIVEYFHGRQALSVLRGWMAPDTLTQRQAEEKKTLDEMLSCPRYERCHHQHGLPEAIVAAWGLKYVSRWDREEQDNTYVRIPFHERQNILHVQGYDFVMLQIWINENRVNKTETFRHPRLPGSGYAYYLTPEGDAVLEITSQDKPYTSVTLPLGAAVRQIQAANTAELPDDQADMARVMVENEKLRAEFRISSVNFSRKTAAKDKQTDGAPTDDKKTGDQPLRPQSVNGMLLFTLR